MTHYCIFDENEASTIIVYTDKDEEKCVRPLCASCYDAYSMGERLATEHIPVEEFDADDYADDYEDDEEGDDICDMCMRSGVEISHTDDDGNTVCVDCAEEVEDE